MTTLNLARAQSLPRGKRWHICRSLKKMQSPPVPYLEFPQDFRSRRFAFFASHVLGFGDLSQPTNLDRRGEFMSFTHGFSQLKFMDFRKSDHSRLRRVPPCRWLLWGATSMHLKKLGRLGALRRALNHPVICQRANCCAPFRHEACRVSIFSESRGLA